MSKHLEVVSSQIDTLLEKLRLASGIKGKAMLDTYVQFAGRYLINSDAHELAQTDFNELTANGEQAWSFAKERKTSRQPINRDQSARRTQHSA